MLEEANLLISEYEVINEADAEIFCFKGIISYTHGKLKEAELYFRKGLVLNGSYFDLNFNLAIVYEELGNYENAFRYYTKAKKYSSEAAYTAAIEDKLLQYNRYSVLQPQVQKRVLIIAHIFPPMGGSGVQRTLKFVKYLQEQGWEPIVVTTGKTSYSYRDETLLGEVPAEIEILRVDEPQLVLNQEQLDELMVVYNKVINKKEVIEQFLDEVKQSKLSILQPDENILWGLQVIETVKLLIDLENIDLIYTTAAPFTDHVIGYLLKSEFNKPWVADFRDEWINNAYQNYDRNSALYKVKYCMEKNVVGLVDEIITTTPYAAKNFRERYDLNEQKVKCITNGYDEEDFVNIQNNSEKNSKFTILHNGLLYLIRTPFTFMQALSNLIKQEKISRDLITVGFTGSNDVEVLKKAAERFELMDILEFYDYLSHDQSLALASRSDLLLLIVGPGEKSKSMYPGKIFEYLRLNKDIFSLSPKGSLVEKLLFETNRGINVEFDHVKMIEEAILHYYNKWVSDDINDYCTNSQITMYERRNQVKQLAGTFDEVMEHIKKHQQRTKICFFSHKDGDKFLTDIIQNISTNYQVKKIIVENEKQLIEGMLWGDICWFEWCDTIFAHATNLPLASEKKIICRIHSYEVFTDNPTKVNWTNVDKVIVVADHLQELLKLKVPNIEKTVDMLTIRNGVNISRFNFNSRSKGYNIAFVGHMIPMKNPMMTLQIAKKIIEIDSRYKLFIAGSFPDKKLELYWDYMVKEMCLEENVFFDGFQVDICNWLKDKHYLLSTTIHESFGYGIAEAMAMGIKPIIHNYVYSKETWPEKYLFNTEDEAIKSIISEDYNSFEYREYIEKKYSLYEQMEKISNMVHSFE
ncbi:D-inositol-3-phosphate glycosyltransferase [compost metagenome]